MKNAAAAAVVVCALCTVQAQPPPGPSARSAPSRLSALDYFEIQQLSARFAHGMDTGVAEGAMAANVFTIDGLLIDPRGRRAKGRAAVEALAREDPQRRKGPTNVSELLANLVVDPSEGGAIARTYVLFAAAPLPGQPRGIVTTGGQYRDDLVRTSEGWRIRRRVFVPADGPEPVLPRLTPGEAPPPPAPRPTSSLGLSADDFVGIERLYADYGHTFDTGSENGYGWANLYTPDGVHVNVVNSLEYIKGRDLLAAFAFGAYRVNGGFSSFNAAQAPTKTFLSLAHIQTSILLEPTPDGVAAKPYRLTGALGADNGVTLTPGGVYYDLLVRDAERWRFAASWYLLPGLRVPDAIARFISPVATRGGYAPPASSSVVRERIPADDHVEIHQLYARTAQALDSAMDNGNAYARSFTDDGVFTDAAGTVHKGRVALAALARGEPGLQRGPAHVEHFVWQIHLEPVTGADRLGVPEVRGRAYVVMVKPRSAGAAEILNGGQYWDDLVKTPDGWRIRSRTFRRVERN